MNRDSYFYLKDGRVIKFTYKPNNPQFLRAIQLNYYFPNLVAQYKLLRRNKRRSSNKPNTITIKDLLEFVWMNWIQSFNRYLKRNLRRFRGKQVYYEFQELISSERD